MSNYYSVIPSESVHGWKKPSGSINKLNQTCIFESDNPHGFPQLKPYTGEIPKRLVSWHTPAVKSLHASVRDSFVHFMVDDYYFESVWTSPKRLLTVSGNVRGILSPTFSVYEVHPRAMNIWNVYRQRWVCKYLEIHGVQVIPVALWADESTFDYCFEGIPRDSVVCVSTVGTRRLADRALFQKGLEEMFERLNPRVLLVYGEYMPVDFSEYMDDVYYYPSEWQQKRERMDASVPVY